MDLGSYADALNLQLRITRYSNQGGRYVARFEDCETKDGPDDGCLSSTYGSGGTATHAVDDYATKLRGKILVVDATSKERRREYLVPKTLGA